MAKPEGEKCSRCGGDVGNGDITQAATVNYLSEGGDVVTLKVCAAECLSRAVTARSYPARAASEAGLPRPAKR